MHKKVHKSESCLRLESSIPDKRRFIFPLLITSEPGTSKEALDVKFAVWNNNLCGLQSRKSHNAARHNAVAKIPSAFYWFSWLYLTDLLSTSSNLFFPATHLAEPVPCDGNKWCTMPWHICILCAGTVHFSGVICISYKNGFLRTLFLGISVEREKCFNGLPL